MRIACFAVCIISAEGHPERSRLNPWIWKQGCWPRNLEVWNNKLTSRYSCRILKVRSESRTCEDGDVSKPILQIGKEPALGSRG